MKVVLFDLGDTLEDRGMLRDGAHDLLAAISARPDVVLALASDFRMPDRPADIPAIRREYVQILVGLGIRAFFEPVDERVTLSTEVGVGKPDAAVFRAVVAKLGGALSFADVLFVTENREHVRAARRLGLRAAHLRGPGQATGEVATFADLLPVVRGFAGATVAAESPPASRPAPPPG